MKKAFLFVFLVAALAGGAQEKVQQKDLLGSWELRELTVAGIRHDYSRKKTEIPDRLDPAATGGQDSLTLLRISRMLVEMLERLTLTFSGNGQYFERLPGGNVQQGVFSLDEEGGKLVSRLDGTVDVSRIAFRKGELVLSRFVHENLEAEIVFKKIR